MSPVHHVLQGTVNGGRRQCRKKKRWEGNSRVWTGLEVTESQKIEQIGCEVISGAPTTIADNNNNETMWRIRERKDGRYERTNIENVSESEGGSYIVNLHILRDLMRMQSIIQVF